VSADDARRVIAGARAAGVFPAATMEAGSSASPIWSDACGTDLHAPFDLASLTKAIATTTLVLELVRTGALRFEEPVSAFFGEWRGADREAVTVRDLLEHASGLPGRLVDAPPVGRREFEHDICATRLEYAPRTQSIYSDLGFILLGFLVADRGGASLDTQFDRLMVRLPPSPLHGFGVTGKPDLLTFDLPADVRRLAAPTRPMNEDSRRGRSLAGEVHDNYAAALGGVAGHAGLFGTAPAVGAFARAVLRAARGDRSLPPPFSPELVAAFTTKTTVPGSSRALGWDTMLPTSSCGTRLSPRAFGHVGYTGTSLWIDPVRDRYFTLLTNRVYGGGTLGDMRTVRRAFHDALGDI
jgi:CubicO group peptidase (beta-lactamase class C family)